jgi:Ca2+:H+ antiporter
MLPNETVCQRCYQHQPNPADDMFFQRNVKPLMYFCCIILPSAYLIGIWFSLRTHVKQIWHEPQHPSNAALQDSSIYRKLLPTHIVQQLLHYGSGAPTPAVAEASGQHGDEETGHGGYHASAPGDGQHQGQQDRNASGAGVSGLHPVAHGLLSSLAEGSIKNVHDEEDEAHAGHDSPNWSKGKSATVLLGCTILYSIIAGKEKTTGWR